jgi:hypothetical protein
MPVKLLLLPNVKELRGSLIDETEERGDRGDRMGVLDSVRSDSLAIEDWRDRVSKFFAMRGCISEKEYFDRCMVGLGIFTGLFLFTDNL